MTALDIAQALGKFHITGNGYMACCPAHDDNNPSLHISDSDDGKLLVHCHAGCPQENVIAALKSRELWPSLEHDKKPLSAKPQVTGQYEYRDRNGNLRYWKERLEPGRNGQKKEFLFYHYNQEGERQSGRGANPVLYCEDRVSLATDVFFVEGEAHADFLNSWGFNATTLDCGTSSKLTLEQSHQLTGKNLVILPDNDAPGQKYAVHIASTMRGKAQSLKVVVLPGLPEKGDILDWQKTPGNNKGRFLEIIKATPEWEPETRENSLPFSCRRMSDVQPKPVNWLWPGRIARGKVTMIAGHPGLGKSQLTANMAAVVTTGGMWPADKTQCEQGNVILFSAEDDAADTIRPRLEAAGADLDRVFILDTVIEDSGSRQRSFNLASDLCRLGEMISHIGNVALIVIDPITAYIGGTDSHKNADMRALLSPLGELAAKHCAAVVCISHLNKGGGGEALMRVAGSLAFVAAARAAWAVVKDQNNPERRFFLPLKNNVGNDQTGLCFRIVSHELPGGIETSRVLWEEETVTVSADQAMAPLQEPAERSALGEAKEFLVNILKDGPVSVRQIRSDAEDAGYAWRTLQRAKDSLGISATKGGMKNGWSWSLPSKNAKQIEECQSKSVETFGYLGNLRQRSACSTDVPSTIIMDVDDLFKPDMASADDVVAISGTDSNIPFFDFDEEPNESGEY